MMKHKKGYSRSDIPDHLFDILAGEFDGDTRALDLFDEFFRHKDYCSTFASNLIDVAKGSAGDSWEIRRLAVLMLEHQVLKLPVESIEEFDSLFTRLNLKSDAGTGSKVKDSVLKEGYSTTDLRGFVLEVRRNLERLKRVHDQIRGKQTAREGLADFIHISRRECKLALGRYLFTPEEVVERILDQVRVSAGMIDPSVSPNMEGEVEHALSGMPDYEASILRRLLAVSKIYWVSDATSSEVNSLVEYPLTTVVLVVKPPGSSIEFEIKRAGRRGDHPLSVVYRRDEKPVPPSHRLDGGSMKASLVWEAAKAIRFANIFRLVHEKAAPVSRAVSIFSKYCVPSEDGEERILDYFTDPSIFGDGFSEMRTAMERSVEAFERERGSDSLGLPGELGLTVRFFTHAAPGQAILSGTSSFRLNLLRDYLSAEGPYIYFEKGLKVEYTKSDARRFADEILEEALGVYTPPDIKYRDHEQYIEAAFSVPENRAAADRNYLSVMQQIGTFWGTLMAVGGHSNGESFVGRNVGLKSLWEEGRWKVKIIFMDHDMLNFLERGVDYMRPHWWLPGTVEDEHHILSNSTNGQKVFSEMDFLGRIYRVEEEIARKGRNSLYEAMGCSYKKTHDEIVANRDLQKLFSKKLVKRFRDWDAIVGGYLRTRQRFLSCAECEMDSWKAEAENYLKRKRYKKVVISGHIETVEKYADFLERYSFLYQSSEARTGVEGSHQPSAISHQ
ncbi:MAG: hypothetical protein L0229_30045 [Blastocatellia bacterium]|nr:hypothetical protein [Blastocatellia bacterium]